MNPITVIGPAAAITRTLTLTAGGQAQFRFPFEPEIIAELKERIVNVSWNGTLRAWTVRTRAANIRAIAGFARDHGFGGIEAAADAQTQLFAEARESIAASRAADDVEFVPPATLGGILRPFQKAGVAYAVQQARGCLLADEMGLGKTVEAIATLETLQAFPAVIVCPASLKLNWQRELAAWLPHRTVQLIEGGSIPGPADVAIVNYELLAKKVDALRARQPQAVVFDEGHLLKSPKCQRARAAKKLRVGVPVRLLLTGTPVLNSPSELLCPLAILGRLDDLGGFWHFAERYCGGREVERAQRGTKVTRKVYDMSGASHLPELAGRLRATCMVRRRKRDVLAELPPKQMAMLPVDLSVSARTEYDLAQRDVLAWVAKRAGRDPEFRALIADLDEEQQIAAVLHRAQRAVDRAAQAEELVRIEALKQISARGKLDAAQEWIGNFLATGEKLVVFAWHQEILEALSQAFNGAPMITGQTPLARRQAIVDDFQRGRECGIGKVRTGIAGSNPAEFVRSRGVIGNSLKIAGEWHKNGQLVFLNLQAGGVGITLTAASHVLVLELPWTPALLDQAIDRCHRIGQRDAVTAWLMLGRRTIDTPIWQMLQKKRTTAEAATR